MTAFQFLSLGLFLVALAGAYGKDIVSAVRTRFPALPSLPDRPVVVPPVVGIRNSVNDMITVAELRDRMRALDCKEGVDACTYLLKVLVEFQYPQG
jgi:hypothetical protein